MGVLGAAVRVEQFASRRSLWLDEALVANNIASRSFTGLLKPLSGEQGAPVGWLWGERSALLVFGHNEFALRLIPLVAGVAALVLVHRTAERMLGPWPAVVAVAVLAFSPEAVRYSVEVKQYSTDLAIAALLILLALRALEQRHARSWSHWAWATAGAVVVWWSHPAVFVVAATGLVLAVDAAVRQRWRDVGRVVAAGVVVAASFGGDWAVSLRRLGHDRFLHSYWAAGFAPRPLREATLVPWIGRTLRILLKSPGGLSLTALGIAAVVAGLLVAVRRRPAAAALVVMPVAAGAGAAVVGAYPLDGRLALWLLPVLAVGLAGCVAWSRLPAVAAGTLVAAVLLASPASAVAAVARRPTVWSDTRPLLQAVRARLEPGDRVWVARYDEAVLEFYAPTVGVTPSAVVYGAAPCQGTHDFAAAAGGRRVWFVYAYHHSGNPADEASALVARMEAHATLREVVHRHLATAYLLDFGGSGRARSPDDLACASVAA